MKPTVKVIPGINLKPHLPPNLALRRVISRSGRGVYASCDTLFRGAIFGRDSIEVAEDLLLYKPRLVKRIILTLASLQGEMFDDITEEEPGKIIHEYRTPVVDGKRLKGVSEHIYKELCAKWGGTDKEMAYYGSVDATPHFVRLVYAFCNKYGPKLLDERVALRSGHKLSMQLVIENCIDWLIKRQDASSLGLIEYKRTNPQGLLNQVWKDSNEFYIHTDGKPANHEAPIASVEVQGLAFDAFIAATRLLRNPRADLRVRAERIRFSTLQYLWLPDDRYFGLGIDYGKRGKPRIMGIHTANPASLLDTRMFDDLPEQLRHTYVSSIIKTIFSPEFLTDAGIRSRALSGANLVSFWDYHGSYVSWPKETYDIAKGLKRQGFPELAKQLENRLLNVVLKNREYPEFVYVDEWGRVLNSSPAQHEHANIVVVDSTNNPERIQAWTVSAIVAIVTERLRAKVASVGLPRKPYQTAWQNELEKHIMTHIPQINRMINPFSLSARYPTYQYKLDKK